MNDYVTVNVSIGLVLVSAFGLGLATVLTSL